jgi:hypothetical protein
LNYISIARNVPSLSQSSAGEIMATPKSHATVASVRVSSLTAEQEDALRQWAASPQAREDLIKASNEAQAIIDKMRKDRRVDFLELHRPICRL